MRIRRTTLGVQAAIALALLLGGTVLAVGVSLPPTANPEAVSATTGSSAAAGITTGGGATHPQVVTLEAAFGQCVSEEAKDASEEGGEGWTPVSECESLSPAGGAATSSGATSATSARLANAMEHASAQGGQGLENAQVASENGARHANDNAGHGQENAEEHGPE